MAQNTAYNANSTWQMITDSDVTAITFQNLSNFGLEVYATAGTSAPSETVKGVTYNALQGERNANLSDIFPGVSGANRVWVRGAGLVFVSHA